jgi:3'-5' exoribonuclease
MTQVRDLIEGQKATGRYLVSRKFLSQRRDGGDFLRLNLTDATGTVHAILWQDVASVLDTFQVDDIVEIRGQVHSYNGNLQIRLESVQRVDDDEIDWRDYQKSSPRHVREYLEEINRFVASVEDPYLQSLLQAFFEDKEFTGRFLRAPGGKRMHHDYLGGLAEHVVEVTRLCDFAAAQYPGLNRDLLIAGALLHDIGKVEEMYYQRSFDYTTEGRLVGHVNIGLVAVERVIAGLPGFPENYRQALAHCILSHHGLPEYGAPRTPMTPEALILHFADSMDSKYNSMVTWIRERPDGEKPGWTHLWPNGEVYVYFGASREPLTEDSPAEDPRHGLDK